MAEAASILNPAKEVSLPDLNTCCSLEVLSATTQFKQFRKKHPDHIAVTYINCFMDSSHYILCKRELVITENKDFGRERQEKKTKVELQDQNLKTQATDEQAYGQAEYLVSEEDDPKHVIEDLSEQIKVLQNKLLRQLAESGNICSRSTKLVDEARDYAVFGFSEDLVPLMDNLSRALEHLPENLKEDVKNVSKV